MKLFYINQKQQMSRDCLAKTNDCAIVEYMRSQGFDVKTLTEKDIQKVMFEVPYNLSAYGRGLYAISWVKLCSECNIKTQGIMEKIHQRAR